MNIRTSSCAASSLNTAAFRTVLARDSRRLAYSVRREIVTLRRLREDPFPPVRAFGPRGRIRTSRDIRTVTNRVLKNACAHEDQDPA